MPQNGNGNEWVPMVHLDLTVASKTAFDDVVAEFARQTAQREAAGTLPELPALQDGWLETTPQMAETFLRHTGGNRPMVFSTVKLYANDMVADDWKPTGQPIIFSQNGKYLRDGHHRLWACYLTGRTFRVFVVASAPDFDNQFAYLDCGKKRTNADALAIAGWGNGLGKVIASAISKIAVRYDLNKIACENKQPRMRPVNPRETLAYMSAHPDFKAAAHYMIANHAAAMAIIGSQPAAVFFGWLVIRAYGEAVLNDFVGPLTTGADLAEDSPILGLRNKLATMPMDDKPAGPQMRLAYVNKAFLLHVAGQRMGRTRGGRIQPLSVDLREPFPRIEIPTESEHAAA